MSESKKELSNNLMQIIDKLQEYFPENISADDLKTLFEDVLNYFEENNLDIVQIQDLDADQQIELFTELKTLIELLTILKSQKSLSLQNLMEKLISTLSKTKKNKASKLTTTKDTVDKISAVQHLSYQRKRAASAMTKQA